MGPPLPAALKDTQLHYHWDLAMVLADTDRWWHGIGITLLYSVATVAGGIVIGVFCGLTLLGQKRWLTLPLEGYVEIFRCTPLCARSSTVATILRRAPAAYRSPPARPSPSAR